MKRLYQIEYDNHRIIYVTFVRGMPQQKLRISSQVEF
jgi:hypothetical protein